LVIVAINVEKQYKMDRDFCDVHCAISMSAKNAIEKTPGLMKICRVRIITERKRKANNTHLVRNSIKSFSLSERKLGLTLLYIT
jgi:hypothetical protein